MTSSARSLSFPASMIVYHPPLGPLAMARWMSLTAPSCLEIFMAWALHVSHRVSATTLRAVRGGCKTVSEGEALVHELTP